MGRGRQEPHHLSLSSSLPQCPEGVPILSVLVLSPKRREVAPGEVLSPGMGQVRCPGGRRGWAVALPPWMCSASLSSALPAASSSLFWAGVTQGLVLGAGNRAGRRRGGHCSQTPGRSREPRRAPGPAPACLAPSWTWSPGVEALSPSSCPRVPVYPHYLSLSASCLFRRSFAIFLAFQYTAPGTLPPPLPASPPSGLPLSLAAPGAPVTASRPPRTPPLPGGAAEKAPGGDGLGASPPPSHVGGALGWGRVISRGARVLAWHRPAGRPAGWAAP